MRDIAIPRVYGNIMIDHVEYPRLDGRVGAFLCRDPSHGTAAAAATTTDEVALEQRNDFGRGRRGGEDDFTNGPTTDSGRRGGF